MIKIFYYGGKLHKIKLTVDGSTIIRHVQEVKLNPSTTIVNLGDSLLIKDGESTMTLTATVDLNSGSPYADGNVSASTVAIADFDALYLKISSWRNGMLTSHVATSTGAIVTGMDQYNSFRASWIPAGAETNNLEFTAAGVMHTITPNETSAMIVEFAGLGVNDLEVDTIPSGTVTFELGLHINFK